MSVVGMVMPVYDQDPNYLVLSIDSVLQQTYQEFHLVIVIDGANKQTRDIVYQYKSEPRITIIDKPVNEGIAHALNTGFDYLFRLDEVEFLTWGSSDNIIYPDFFLKLHNKLKDSVPNVGLVYSCFDHIDGNGKLLYTKTEQDHFRKWQENKTLDDLLDFSFIGTSFMYKKAYAKRIGGYYLDPVQTYDYWLRLTEICDVVFVPEELMAYRFHSSLSLSKKIQEDKTKHRWWRDQYNLARHKARERRGLSYETTILFPVLTFSETTIEDIENLLDQRYHNYLLVIIDKTKQVTNKLKSLGINDPRITVIERAGGDNNLLNSIQAPKTLYKLVYTNQYNLSDVNCLSNIIRI